MITVPLFKLKFNFLKDILSSIHDSVHLKYLRSDLICPISFLNSRIKNLIPTKTLQNEQLLTRKKHEVTSENEIGFLFSEKEMWANFNDGA